MAKVPVPERNEALEASPTPGEPRRRRWWLPRFLLLLCILILCLPSVLGLFGFVPGILRTIQPRMASAVQFRTISLHWWAPVEIHGVTIRDLSSESVDSTTPLATVPRIYTQEPLWKIVACRGAGITVVVSEPNVRIEAVDGSSNLQKTLTQIFPEPTSSNDSTFPVRIEIQQGEITLDSQSIADSPATMASIRNINGVWSTLNADSILPELQFTALLEERRADKQTSTNQETPANSQTGAYRQNRNQATRIAADLSELTADFPVVPLEGFTLPKESNSVNPSGTAENPAPSEPDQTVNLELRIMPDQDTPGHQTVIVRARSFDLHLIHPLLQTLSPGTSASGVVSCDLEAQLASRHLSDGLVVRILLDGHELRIHDASFASNEWLTLGRTQASGAFALAADGLLFNQLKLTSEVGTLEGAGEIRSADSSADKTTLQPEAAQPTESGSAQVRGKVNIARLTDMLPKTLALRDDVRIQSGNLLFAGKIEQVTGIESEGSNGVFRWQASLQNDRIEATRAEQPLTWDSVVRLDAAGPWKNGKAGLGQARLTADFATLDCIPADSAFDVSGTFEPDRLWQQLKLFVNLPPIGLKNKVQFQSRVLPAENSLLLTDLSMTNSELRARSSTLEVHYQRPVTSMLEGQVHIEGSGAAVKTLISPWHSATWLADQSGIQIDMTADPNRLLNIRALIQPAPVAQTAGTRVRSISSRAFGMSIPSFQINEALVDMNLAASEDGNLFQIQRGTIQLPGLAAVVSGTIHPVGQDIELNLEADTEYDLDILCRRLLSEDSFLLLRGHGREKFLITGSPSAVTQKSADSRIYPVSSTGSLAISPLKASGGITWESGQLWGMQLGPASVKATLADGIVRTEPVQCSVNSGTLSVMPQYDIQAERLQFGTGSRVENVDLTQEVCREWLAYLVPLMADATHVQGTVSARIEHFDYQFLNPERSTINGLVTIHKAQADPGNSLTQLLGVFDLIRRAENSDRSSVVRSITMPEQQIPVELRQGYVLHQGLTLELAGYRTRTSGAVGLNRALQLTVDIPLEKTVEGTTARSLQVPIRGTIDSPQPDTSALLKNLGTQKIEQKINNQLDRQLNKLFDKL